MLISLRLGILLFIITQLGSINTISSSNFCEETVYRNVTASTILRKNILKNYDKLVIPSFNDYLEVSIFLTIINVEMDYEKSQMVVSIWFRGHWHDNRLRWEPDKYEQVDSIMLDHREIWHPDVKAFDSVDINMDGNQVHTNSIVDHNGTVYWLEPMQYTIHCQTDLTNWPYDTPNGILTLGSWLYSASEMNVTAIYDDTSFVNGHSEWAITNVSKKTHVTTYECCTEEEWVHIEYNITIKRKVHPYQSTIYIPALCSAIFNLIIFWLPYSDNYCKLWVNLFNALFVTLNILIIYSKVPVVTSSIPLIAVYYTYSLALIAISTIVSMTVKSISTMNKPLPHEITQWLHSSYMMYLGVETNNSTTDCHMLCESDEMNVKMADPKERKKLAKVIDRMCFVILTIVYLIILLRFMP